MPLTTYPYDSLIPEILVLGADNHPVIMDLIDAFGNNVSVRLFDPQNDGALANAYGREIRTRGIIHGEVWDIKDTSLSELPPTYRPDFIISGRDYKSSETAKKISSAFGSTSINIDNPKNPYELVDVIDEVTDTFPNAVIKREKPRIEDGTKVSVIGAGKVGGLVPEWLLGKYGGQISVVIRNRNKETAKSLEMYLKEKGAAHGMYWDVTGTEDFSEIGGSSVILSTAGVSRTKDDKSRENLAGLNAKIVKESAENISQYSPDSVVINLTNPLDIMTYLLLKHSGLEKERVLGMGNVLDTARLTLYASEVTGVTPGEFKCIVVATHGNGMNPILCEPSFEGVAGKYHLNGDKKAEIYKKTLDEGKHQIDIMGGTTYAASAGCERMASCVIEDLNHTLPCSVLLEGEFRIDDVCIGVPVVVGKNGVVRIRTDYPLTEENVSKIRASAERIKAEILALN